jgi:hypothetical protein
MEQDILVTQVGYFYCNGLPDTFGYMASSDAPLESIAVTLNEETKHVTPDRPATNAQFFEDNQRFIFIYLWKIPTLDIDKYRAEITASDKEGRTDKEVLEVEKGPNGTWRP